MISDEDLQTLTLAERAGLAYREDDHWYGAVAEQFNITAELLAFAELVRQENTSHE